MLVAPYVIQTPDEANQRMSTRVMCDHVVYFADFLCSTKSTIWKPLSLHKVPQHIQITLDYQEGRMRAFFLML